MSDIQAEGITPEEFEVLVRRAGLELTGEEMDRLRPMYETLMGQVAKLHDPTLPLTEPADIFRPDWLH